MRLLAPDRGNRGLAPDTHQIFFEENLAERVEARARFMRIAEAMK